MNSQYRRWSWYNFFLKFSHRMGRTPPNLTVPCRFPKWHRNFAVVMGEYGVKCQMVSTLTMSHSRKVSEIRGWKRCAAPLPPPNFGLLVCNVTLSSYLPWQEDFPKKGVRRERRRTACAYPFFGIIRSMASSHVRCLFQLVDKMIKKSELWIKKRYSLSYSCYSRF